MLDVLRNYLVEKFYKFLTLSLTWKMKFLHSISSQSTSILLLINFTKSNIPDPIKVFEVGQCATDDFISLKISISLFVNVDDQK